MTRGVSMRMIQNTQSMHENELPTADHYRIKIQQETQFGSILQGMEKLEWNSINTKILLEQSKN